jgi:hypothetical protein
MMTHIVSQKTNDSIFMKTVPELTENDVVKYRRKFKEIGNNLHIKNEVLGQLLDDIFSKRRNTRKDGTNAKFNSKNAQCDPTIFLQILDKMENNSNINRSKLELFENTSKLMSQFNVSRLVVEKAFYTISLKANISKYFKKYFNSSDDSRFERRNQKLFKNF